MNESMVRIVMVLILGIVAYWVVKGQITLINAIELQSKSVGDHLTDKTKQTPPITNPIGFKYQDD